MSLIEFRDVSEVYIKGAPPAVDKLSFDIDNGEFVFITGDSGSGKSTIIKLLLRELTPTSGKISVAAVVEADVMDLSVFDVEVDAGGAGAVCLVLHV